MGSVPNIELLDTRYNCFKFLFSLVYTKCSVQRYFLHRILMSSIRFCSLKLRQGNIVCINRWESWHLSSSKGNVCIYSFLVNLNTFLFCPQKQMHYPKGFKMIRNQTPLNKVETICLHDHKCYHQCTFFVKNKYQL